MRATFTKLALGVALAAGMAGSAHAEGAHVAPIKDYIDQSVKSWLNDPVIVEAIKAQNAKNAGLGQSDIETLDQTWRAEVGASSQPMIEAVLANTVSEFLKEKQADAAGMITEVFVMDNKGLNVGQSDVTSDYWQGDEAKWQNTYGAGPDAVFVDEVEKDESTQTLQSQASIAISDPASGEVIGAITIGVNLDQL